LSYGCSFLLFQSKEMFYIETGGQLRSPEAFRRIDPHETAIGF